MENLVNRERYGAYLANEIEKLDSVAIGMENRWVLGWANVVHSMLEANTYFDLLLA